MYPIVLRRSECPSASFTCTGFLPSASHFVARRCRKSCWRNVGGSFALAAAARNNRKPTWSEKKPDGRWRSHTYDEVVNRDKASLDIFWLRDKSLEDAGDLPDPNTLAAEIAEDLESALEQIQGILGDLEERAGE